MKTIDLTKKKVVLYKMGIKSVFFILAIVLCGSIKQTQAQPGRQHINELLRNREIHNGEDCIYIVVNEQGMTLDGIARIYSIDLTTLNKFNRNLRGRIISTGSKVYYPVERLKQSLHLIKQDTSRYDFTIIKGNNITAVHNVNSSNLNLIDREYAIRKIDHQIKIPSRKIMTTDGVLKTIQGEAMQVLFHLQAGEAIIVFENDPLLRYNKEIGKYKGSYNLILLDTNSVDGHNFVIPYSVTEIQLNFYSNYSKFLPEPFKIDSVNVYKKIEITEDLNANNPLQVNIKTPVSDQQFFVQKEPVLKIEELPQGKSGNGPQSVDFKVKLYAYNGSDNIMVSLSTNLGKISPSQVYLKNNSISKVKLKSYDTGTANIKAQATLNADIKTDVKTIVFDIKRTGIKLRVPTRPIQRDDYQYYNIDVSLPLYSGKDSILVSLKSDFGGLSDERLYLKRDESKTINLKSKKRGTAKLKATSEGFDSDEKQMKFTEGPPRIVFNPKDLVVIDAFGLENKEVIVSLQNYIGDENILVNLSIANANVTPLQVILSPENYYSQEVIVESKWSGETTLYASSINQAIVPGELSFKLRFPWWFIVSIILGGSIGALVKYFMKPQKSNKLITSLIYGCLTGLVVTIMVLFLGLKLPSIDLADDKNSISLFIVFGLSLFGSIFWEQIHSFIGKAYR